MKKSVKANSAISRRHFLKTTGVAAGASTFGPLLPAIAKLGSDNPPFRIGVLLPKSRLSQGPAKNMLAGMKLHFDQVQRNIAGRQVILEIGEIGFGAIHAVRASQDLIENRKVDLIVAMASSSIGTELQSLLHDQRTFLLIVNAGANVVRAEDCGPFVFHCSLNCWQASALMARWATDNLGKKAFVAAAFHDSGYDLLHAFDASVAQNGGSVIQTCVSGTPGAPGLPQIMSRIKESKPDFVYASFAGSEALDFVQAYKKAGLTGLVPLVCSSFAVDEDLLPRHGAAAAGIVSASAWAPNLSGYENKRFVSSFPAANGRTPDPFAVLGFDAARLVDQAVSQVGGKTTRIEALRKALENSQFLSPRGLLTIVAKDHTLRSPNYVRKVKWDGNALINEVVEQKAGRTDWQRVGMSLTSNVKTGWLNPYLCV